MSHPGGALSSNLKHERASFCLSDRYQSWNDGGWEAPSANGIGGEGSGDKYAAFAEIVLKFIMDGAPDEVNLRYVRKPCTPPEWGLLSPPL